MQIDNKTYWIDDSNRNKTQSPKTQIIIASSLRKDSNHIKRLQHKEFGKTKKWNTYTISRTGIIYQHYDPKYHSNFIGVKEADKQSISIVLENMGCLYSVLDNKYVNWLNEVCDDNIREKSWFGYDYWENFTIEQINSTVELCKFLCDEFGIRKTLMEFNHFHKETVKFKGIVFKGNYVEETCDLNPLFNITEFSEMLQIK